MTVAMTNEFESVWLGTYVRNYGPVFVYKPKEPYKPNEIYYIGQEVIFNEDGSHEVGKRKFAVLLGYEGNNEGAYEIKDSLVDQIVFFDPPKEATKMATPIQQCAMCRGNGYIYYTDDDSCDVQPCDCTVPVEVKR